MDSADMRAAVSPGDGTQPVRNQRDWHKRLRLRKTAMQSPAMQGRDKHRPKKIAKRRELNAGCPPSNMPPRQGRRGHRTAHNNPSTLRFKCSQCNGSPEFVAKDLVRHFQESHQGVRPDFCCHVCSFRTHELSHLQVHLSSHKDGLLSCVVCKDDIQRTPAEYCSHLASSHSREGSFSCGLCDEFTTGEAHVYLQHVRLHELPTEERAEVDLSSHTRDLVKPVRSKASAQGFQCPHCVYKGPSRRLISKHVSAVHAGQTANENRRKLRRIKISQHDLDPKVRNRVTRNTARDMRWLSKDCLSLPGRGFLDDYCCLSNPERPLEETQQYLMRSAVGEKDGQKWTMALQSVLSTFPQDLNMHPKSDNAVMSNSSKDLAVLMVQNKLKVPQKAGSYVKKTTPPEKLETSPSGSASPGTHGASDPHRDPAQPGSDPTHRPGTPDNASGDASTRAVAESGEGGPIQENRENQELSHRNVEEHGRNCKEITCANSRENGLDASKEPKTGGKQDRRRPARRNHRGRRSSRMMKARPEALEKQLQGLGLKLLLKKDPVKNKQWTSQSPLLAPDGGLAGDPQGLPSPPIAMETQGHTLANGLPPKNSQVNLKECSGAPMTEPDPGSTLASTLLGSQPQPGERHDPEAHRHRRGNGDVRANAASAPAGDARSPSATGFAENLGTALAASGASGGRDGGVGRGVPGAEGGSSTEDMNPLRINGGLLSPAAEALIPSPGAFPAARSSSPGGADPSLPPPGPTASKDPAAAGAGEGPRSVAQRAVERTLRLSPLSGGQAVRRPVGQQPVVVLNHPDADGPPVARLMEAVRRHRGRVQRVALSRRTLDAIAAAAAGGLAATGPPAAGPQPNRPPPPSSSSSSSSSSSVCRTGSVRERFLLKLTLRRTGRRKYQVVRPPPAPAAGGPADPVTQFRCWFCGRAFESQDSWMAHRQRHFMEWRRPNCEEPEMSPTLKNPRNLSVTETKTTGTFPFPRNVLSSS